MRQHSSKRAPAATGTRSAPTNPPGAGTPSGAGAPPGAGAHPCRDPDGTIAALAARQHGVVTRRQLLAAGVSPDVLDRRLKARRLVRLHRGVYRVGPVVAPRAPEMAAVLACGDSAVLAHGSAAMLWRMVPGGRPGDEPEVIHPDGHPCRPGIRVHRLRTLRVDEVTSLDGIPITTPARTLYDLASTVAPRELERALAEALALRLTTLSAIRKLLKHHPRGRGTARLRALVDAGHPALTRSEAEERMLALVRDARLDPPEVNVWVAGFEVDFLWRRERLVVEVDGYAFHSSPGAFENDHQRDSTLAAAGLRVTRFTWKQLTNAPIAVVARLAQALARDGPSRG